MPRDALSRTLESQGQRVYTGWRRFDRHVPLYAKNLINIFGPAGVYKSWLALNIVRELAKRQVPSLYLTLDTPLDTQARRWWSLVNGVDIDAISRSHAVTRHWMSRAQTALRAEGSLPPEWSDIHTPVSVVPDLVASVEEYTGDTPRVIIVDSLRWFVHESSYEGYSEAFNILKSDVATPFRATVITLHHSLKKFRANMRTYLSDVEYTGGTQPDTVCSMYSESPQEARLVILKARDAKSDPNGRYSVGFRVIREQGGRMKERAR